MELYPEWKQLLRRLEQMEYGTAVTHEQMAEMAGVKYPSLKYSYVVSKARGMLLQQQKLLVSLHGKGYRVAEPGEHLKYSQGEFRKGLRRFRKGVEIGVNTNEERLTGEERKQLDAWNERSAKTMGVLTEADRRLRKIASGK